MIHPIGEQLGMLGDAPRSQVGAETEEDKAANDVGTLLDRFQGSAGSKVLRQVDQVLNLGTDIRSLHDLSREELAEAFSILAELFDRGIVGYEYREVNGQPQKVFIDTAIGSDLHRAPLYKNGRLDSYV